jgi:hypothetical protein
MSHRIRIAVAAVVIGSALLTAVAGQSHRNTVQTFRSAQYCVPEAEPPGAQTNIYC